MEQGEQSKRGSTKALRARIQANTQFYHPADTSLEERSQKDP
jgi:hypothetical protein